MKWLVKLLRWMAGVPTEIQVRELPTTQPYRTSEPLPPPEPPQLPLYGSIKACAKCGFGGLSKAYNSVEDVMYRHCTGCGFRWKERPLDSEPIAPGSGVKRPN